MEMVGAMEVALLSPFSSTVTTTSTIAITPFILSSSFSLSTNFLHKNHSPSSLFLSSNTTPNKISKFSSTICCVSSSSSSRSTRFSPPSFSCANKNQRHWMVVMDTPSKGLNSKSDIIDYYVRVLENVLGSKEDAQICIYDASCETHFGFCCDIDEEIARELTCLPGVLSVRPDPDFNSMKKDYFYSTVQSNPPSSSSNINSMLFPLGNSKHWLVRIDKPAAGVIRKPEVVDYCVQILAEVFGNEKDAQMCMYNISWQSNFGFCCELDDECARELAGVPGVLSVQPDENFDSYDKECEDIPVEKPQQSSSSPNSIGTKKLFVTGLSFYTSEKTLRAAFEGFGELVEVRIIMDKISKRSRGYAFIEYTTEEAASAALKEMNGKIINGWMIVVDVAKKTPTRYSSGRPTALGRLRNRDRRT